MQSPGGWWCDRRLALRYLRQSGRPLPIAINHGHHVSLRAARPIQVRRKLGYSYLHFALGLAAVRHALDRQRLCSKRDALPTRSRDRPAVPPLRRATQPLVAFNPRHRKLCATNTDLGNRPHIWKARARTMMTLFLSGGSSFLRLQASAPLERLQLLNVCPLRRSLRAMTKILRTPHSNAIKPTQTPRRTACRTKRRLVSEIHNRRNKCRAQPSWPGPGEGAAG